MLVGRKEDGFFFAWDAKCLVVGVGVSRVGVGHDWRTEERKEEEGREAFFR